MSIGELESKERLSMIRFVKSKFLPLQNWKMKPNWRLGMPNLAVEKRIVIN